MTSASAPPMRAVRPWGQENMTESAATCFSATPESRPSTAGTHIQRNAHFIAAAATAAAAPVTVTGAEAVRKSYPSFWEEYKRLGGSFDVL